MKAVFTFSVVSFSNKINHCFSSDNNILDQTAFSRTVAMYKKKTFHCSCRMILLSISSGVSSCMFPKSNFMSKNFHLTANSTSEGRFIPQSVHRQPKNLIPFGNILFTFRLFFIPLPWHVLNFLGKRQQEQQKRNHSPFQTFCRWFN